MSSIRGSRGKRNQKMKIELIDYKGTRKAFDIPEKDDISAAYIRIISGDETLTILTKDGNELYFDSSDGRIYDFDDGMYFIYGGGIDKLSDPKWIARGNPEAGMDV